MERIAKLLAQRGVGSRRQIENLIREGRVFKNDIPVVLGQKGEKTDSYKLDNKIIWAEDPKHLHLIFNKPTGVITSRVSQKKQCVFDFLPSLQGKRWISVGRLDVASSGLLLFTTDGELAYKLMHPKYKIVRKYLVHSHKVLLDFERQKLLKGVSESDEFLQAVSLEEVLPNWYEITLATGKYHEVRRLFAAVQANVIQLVRTQYGNVHLPVDLQPGQYRYIQKTTFQL